MAAKRIDRNINLDAGIVTFTELSTAETLACNIAELFPMYGDFTETQKRMVAHAINAKCGDSASSPNDPAIPQIRDTWNMVLAGDWSARGDGGGTKQSDLALAVFATMVARGNDVTQDAVNDAVSGWTDDAKKAARNDTDVKRELSKIKTQRQVARDKAAAKAAKTGDKTVVEFKI